MMKGWKIFLVILISLGTTFTVLAQGPVATPSDDEVNRVAKNLYCPVCENVPLDTCETKACKDWREEIRLKLSQGWSDEQIFDYFVEQHGDRVLAAPPARGLNWLVYVVPPIVFIAGIVLLWKVLSGAGAKSAAKAVDQSQAAKMDGDDDSYLSQIEEELEQRE